MKHILIGLLAAIVCLCAAPARGDVLSLIRQGKINEAEDSVTALTSTFSERGNILFYRGLIEPNGDSSAGLFLAALANQVDSQFQEVIVARLAYYNLSKGDLDKAYQFAEKYCTQWEGGSEAEAMARIMVLVHENHGDQVAALQIVEQSLKGASQIEGSPWSVIDKARLIGAGEKAAGLPKMLKRLAQAQSGPGGPIALELLARGALSNQQSSDALQYFTTLKEKYPHAVGLAALADQMAELPEEEVKDAQAEKVTGTYYAVKVGVFSAKANADKQAERCRQAGQPITIDSKVIGDKNYFIVYIGRFRTFSEAEALKIQLEGQFSESYQVSAR